jgi:hypothetical protein
MTDTIDAGRVVAGTALDTTLNELARKVQGSRKLRRGDIAFRLSGQGKAAMVLAADGDGVRVLPAADRQQTPLIEVLGDAETVRKVLAGEVEGRKQFLAGGIRVRGDLRYLSDLALELGLLAKPL